MRFLSRLILDTRHRRVRRDLGDSYQLHRTVLAAFPQGPVGASARKHFDVLYRVEPFGETPALVRLLVQSSAAPDWAALPAEALGPVADARGNPAVRRVDEEYGRIAAGARLVFRLRANVTRRLSDRTPGREDRLVGKRVALLREAEQLEWLERKGAQHGFRLLATELNPDLAAVQASAQATERGRRPGRDGAGAMALCFGAVLFNGRLEVTDADLFRAALASGIGSGKAFGFGLLSVAAQ